MCYSVFKTIRYHWKVTLFVLFFLPILIYLGCWQLDRAQQKRVLEAVYQQQQALPAIPLQTVSEAVNLNYRNVTVQGHYNQQQYWLLDNRARDGKVGYEVIMPLVNEHYTVLVNRGWVKAPLHREQLPDIQTPSETLFIEGQLYPAPQNALIKHSQSDLVVNWPKRVLHLDHEDAKKILNNNVYPLILRIADDSPSALVTQWSHINMRPEKHQAYAVQWFAMALLLVGLYAWFLFREKRDSTF